jgi:hypothetical protein
MGRSEMGRRGLPGNLVEPYRAGMIATAVPFTGLHSSAKHGQLSNEAEDRIQKSEYRAIQFSKQTRDNNRRRSQRIARYFIESLVVLRAICDLQRFIFNRIDE